MDKYIKIEDAAKAFSFHTPYCYDDCLNDLRSSILNGFIHYYDVAPVVHGKFVKSEYHDDRLVCTVCGFDNKVWLSFCNYCPNCGAKMDL